MAHEKKCIVCGTQYKYCSHCSEYNSEETWRHLFCSENCKGIFDVFMKVRDGVIDKETGKKMLKKYDLSKLNTFSDQVKSVISPLANSAFVAKEKEEIANLEIEVDDTASIVPEEVALAEEVAVAEEPSPVDEEETPVEESTPSGKFFYKKNKNK